MFGRKNKNQPSARMPQTSGQPANVFSYHASRSGNEANVGRGTQSLQAPKRNHGLVLYLPTFVAAGIMLFGVIYLLTLDTTPRFIPLTTDNKNLLKTTEYYDQQGEDIFKRSILSRSKLSIDTNKLAAELRETFPEFSNIEVIVPLFSRHPIVQVKPATPAFILANQSGAFVIETEGRAVMKASEAPSSLRDNLITVTDDVQLKIEKGKPALPVATVQFITEVIGQLKAKNIAVKSITLPVAANQLNIYLSDKPYYGKFDTEGEARVEAGTFIATKERLEQGSSQPVDYIDVRIDGRAYYK